jgi:hypothetical protein
VALDVLEAALDLAPRRGGELEPDPDTERAAS